MSGKPSWKYNPAIKRAEASGGGWTVRGRERTVAEDDLVVVVELLKSQRQQLTREQFHAWVCQLLNRGPLMATDQYADDFRKVYGDSALYRAVADAIEVQ